MDKSSPERYYDVRILAPILGAGAAWVYAFIGYYQSFGFITLTGEYGETPDHYLWTAAIFTSSFFAAMVRLLQSYHWRLPLLMRCKVALLYAALVNALAFFDASSGGKNVWFVACMSVLGICFLQQFGWWFKWRLRDLEIFVDQHSV